MKERMLPSTNISTGYNHLTTWDIASNPNTIPDVIRAVFCIKIFKLYYRNLLGVVIQHIIDIPKIPKYKGEKSFLIARKRTIMIITKIIFLRKGCLIDIPFIVSLKKIEIQLKLGLIAYISRKLIEKFFSFQQIIQEVSSINFNKIIS